MLLPSKLHYILTDSSSPTSTETAVGGNWVDQISQSNSGSKLNIINLAYGGATACPYPDATHLPGVQLVPSGVQQAQAYGQQLVPHSQ